MATSQSNTTALLTYILGFVTGIIFVMTEKNDKFVRFHAFQSIYASVFFLALQIFLSTIGLGLLTPLTGLAGLAIFIVLMVKAYQGEKFKLPVIGDMAEKNA